MLIRNLKIYSISSFFICLKHALNIREALKNAERMLV